MSQITFEIVKHLGTIRRQPTGWSKELNLVSWNGGEPKYDIREWDPAHERMTRGITLTKDDFEILIDIAKGFAKDK